jgi:hypothetical protein
VVCVEVTKEFPAFSSTRGNDLSTPVPEIGFAGLNPSDRWCLCTTRWQEGLTPAAPRVVLRATPEEALEYVSLADFERHAFDLVHRRIPRIQRWLPGADSAKPRGLRLHRWARQMTMNQANASVH